MTPSGPIFRIKPPTSARTTACTAHGRRSCASTNAANSLAPKKLQRQTYEHRGDHQQRETFAGLPEDKDAAQDFKAPLHVFRPEKYPQEGHEVERQQPCRAHAAPVQSRAGREPIRPETLFQFMEGMDDGQPHPMHDSPDQKTDIRAVPQPAERHRDDQVQVAVPRRLPPSGIYR